MPDPVFAAEKDDAGKWWPTINGRRIGGSYYRTRRAAREAAEAFARNGWR